LLRLIATGGDILSVFIGAAVCFCIVLVPYLLRQGGAGDTKLAAVIGTALGLQQGIFVITIAYVLAATFAIIDIVVFGKGFIFFVKSFYHRIGSWFLPLWIAPPDEEELKLLKKPLPLAPCFCIAGILVAGNVLNLLLPK
jgi:prepilin signal peptidase PulO-like enzyme (type II secretory pathway)